MISSQLELHRLATARQPRVVAAMTLLKRYLFKYQGHVGAALVLGGVDCTGPSLYSIHPHGSTDKLPYVTMGSGSLAAMATFEAGFKEDMEEAEAVALVGQAIEAGIFNDLGSGSNVDICVITKEGHKLTRGVAVHNKRSLPLRRVTFPPGTTGMCCLFSYVSHLTEVLPPLKSLVEVTDAMDTK